MNLSSYLPWIIVGVLAIVALAVFAASTGKGTSSPAWTLPYEKEPSLLTQDERAFFLVLERSIPPNTQLFAKVRLIDLIRVRSGSPNIQAHKNRVIQRHVDFVLCSAGTFEPLLVVELDDVSHQRAKTQERDAFVNSAMLAAGLPIIHITAKASYNREELADRIHSLLAAPAEQLSITGKK